MEVGSTCDTPPARHINWSSFKPYFIRIGQYLTFLWLFYLPYPLFSCFPKIQGFMTKMNFAFEKIIQIVLLVHYVGMYIWYLPSFSTITEIRLLGHQRWQATAIFCWRFFSTTSGKNMSPRIMCDLLVQSWKRRRRNCLCCYNFWSIKVSLLFFSLFQNLKTA